MKIHSSVLTLALALATTYGLAQARPGENPGVDRGMGQQQPGMQQPGMERPNAGSDVGQPTSSPQHDTDRDRDRDDRSTGKVDDQTLHSEIHQKLASKEEFKQVQVRVENGVVYLDGSVPSKEDRKEAKKLVKFIAGVREVKDNLSIAGSTSASAGASSDTSAKAGEPQSQIKVVGQEPATGASASSSTGTGGVSGQATAPSNAGSIAGNTQSSAGTTVAGTGSVSGNAGQAGTMPQSSTSTSSTTSSTTTTQQQGSTVTPSQEPMSGSSSTSTASQGGISGTTAGASTGANNPTQSTTGSLGTPAGQTSSSTGVSTETAASTQLQQSITNALHSDPALAGSNVMVNVTDSTIELTGSVPTGKERQTAKRIAQSYAQNRKVVDRITVTGRGQGANQEKGMTAPDNTMSPGAAGTGANSGAGATNPSSNSGTGTTSGTSNPSTPPEKP